MALFMLPMMIVGVIFWTIHYLLYRFRIRHDLKKTECKFLSITALLDVEPIEKTDNLDKGTILDVNGVNLLVSQNMSSFNFHGTNLKWNFLIFILMIGILQQMWENF